MANTYRALTAFAEALYQAGEFEHDFAAADERDLIERGHVELVPRRYKVLSTNFAEGAKGDVVTLALLKEPEAMLLAGGHLEREKDVPPAKADDTADKPADKHTSRKG